VKLVPYRILVAGVGNVLKGDDGIGVWVVRELAKRRLPPDVLAVDYGLSALKLVYDMSDYDYVIIVDAMELDEHEDVHVLKVEPEGVRQIEDPGFLTQAGFHEVDVDVILSLAKAWDMFPRRSIYVVGIKPYEIVDRAEISTELSTKLTFFVDLVSHLITFLLKGKDR
jgi:hydrogenase maturation protease